MTLPQIVSFISVLVLTTVATVIGIQIILLLKEIRHSLLKFNGALDATEMAMKSLSKPVSNMLAVAEGLKHSTKIIEIFSSFINKQRSNPL